MATSTGADINFAITRQQWENMKPFIRSVYIDENKSFLHLANALQIKFGFKPTRRQFSRKIEEWGFRKNISKSERQRILKNFDSELASQPIDLEDRRVNIRKLENWRRRYKEDAGAVAHSSCSTVSKTNAFQFSPEPQIKGSRSPRNFQAQSQEPHRTGNINSFPSADGIATDDHDTKPKNGNATNAWLFDWSTADIHGSPKLSRLFESLEIECSVPIPDISLDTDALEEHEYINQDGLSQLSTKQNKPQTLKLEDFPRSLSSGLKQKDHDLETGFLPWRNSQLAFWGWNVSPLHEIYVFPKSSTKSFLKDPTRAIERLEAQSIECQSKLDKLTPLCGTQHPCIRTMMSALAKVYHGRGRYKEAERWHRAVFDANREALGAENFVTLDAGLSWIDALMAQGRYIDARTHISRLGTTILTVFGHQSVLSTRASFIEARIAGTMGDFANAEVLTREVLQKRLNDLGPRDPDTWRSIDYLAWVLEQQSRFSGAEKLSRISLQLYHKVSGLDEQEVLSPKRYLSLICSYQGRYDESRDLSRLLQENLEASLGAEHPWALETQYAIAVSLRREGKFLESERLYRKVWSQRMKVLGESHPDTWSTASSLAYLLYRMNRFEEAILWYERFFWQRLEIYGPSGDKTMNAWSWLGDCYQELGRYDDALRLYQQIAGKIRTANGEQSPALAQVQYLINWIMPKILEPEREDFEECPTVKERRKRREEKG